MTLSQFSYEFTWKRQVRQILIYQIDELVLLVGTIFFLSLKAFTLIFKSWIHGGIGFENSKKYCIAQLNRGGKNSAITGCWKDDTEKSRAPSTSQPPRFLSQINDTSLNEELKNGSVTAGQGFSFSAAGFLFPYYLGATHCLMQHGYITENTPLAGASAGAIACGAIVGGIPIHEALKATKLLAQDCRTYGTLFKVRDILRVYFNRYLPPDAYLRANGRMRVAITQVFRSPKGILVDHFTSNEDLINAVLASCFIPGFVAARPCTLFRGSFVIDGGLTYFTPPTAAKKTVGISAFQIDRFGLDDIEISPHLNPQNAVSPSKLLGWALHPQADSTIDTLFSMGYRNARAWIDKRARQANLHRT
ncbi:hypothetical protein O6H91_05G121800 [Diphasiastrum complanatum]|uniref:Uncharacterized protein n=3 Tax=Diphasiastrum complanatum TaxID=34168 RepID=A0ACC2DSV0_DIPCM|nr:hypothetical protein O6H91_05G121800 [Diphasiastrum complanatum]KAJ7557320.1 hypothetical protein O6H91_05G121800 [Diphasiastrum complanatum]KAJ7557321.1 hypothetical protein O6H91_05G121800 [Diphasiastrum complanatum]